MSRLVASAFTQEFFIVETASLSEASSEEHCVVVTRVIIPIKPVVSA